MAPVKRNAEQALTSSPPPKKKKAAFETAAASRPRRTRPDAVGNGEPVLSTSKAAVKSESATRKPRNPVGKASKVTSTTNVTKPTEVTKLAKPGAETGKRIQAAPSGKVTKNVKGKSTKSTKSGLSSNGSAELRKTSDALVEAPITNRLASDAKNGEGEGGRSYWLMKAEPESRMEKGVDVKFSIDDLAAKEEPEAWDGVRNPTARNNMRAMKKGDLAFFYHSNCKVPGIAGIMEIVREHSVDESAFDEDHPYFDQKSSRDKPKWCVVHVKFRKKLDVFIKLKELQKHSKQGCVLEDMQVLRMSRLSVSKVSRKEWDFILGLAKLDPETLEAAAESEEMESEI